MSFNNKIKELREKENLTQQDIADKLFVSRQSVCRWEKGTRTPDIFIAKKLAIELHTSLDELISEDDLYRNKKEKMEAQSFALEGISAISQVFMMLSLINGNHVWRAFLAISLFGFACMCFKRWLYRFEKSWCICGILCILLGIMSAYKYFGNM